MSHTKSPLDQSDLCLPLVVEDFWLTSISSTKTCLHSLVLHRLFSNQPEKATQNYSCLSKTIRLIGHGKSV